MHHLGLECKELVLCLVLEVEEVTALWRCTNPRHLVAQASKYCTVVPIILTSYCSICSLTYQGVYHLTCTELIVLDDVEVHR